MHFFSLRKTHRASNLFLEPPEQVSKTPRLCWEKMERRALLRSLSYAASCKRLFLEPSTRSMPFFSTSVEQNLIDRFPPSSFLLHKRAFSLLPRSVTTSPNQTSPVTDYRLPVATGIGSRRLFSVDVSPLPVITDPDVKGAFKDLMAASWDELPDTVTHDAKAALSKDTKDKAGQEALANVFRAAEAVEQFAGVLVSLRMELDDSIGLSGEKVGHLTDEFQDALHAAYTRYVTYLDAFGPDETYLRKKVETELGTKMIHIKMRCSGLDSEWGKVTVLGTSGIAGSYVEHRAP